MRKKRKLVDIQDLQEINGQAGAYGRYVERSPRSRSEDGSVEDILANPDELLEQSASPSTPQLLMGEAIEHLQGRQKEVYISIMREDRSLAETGELLGVGKSTVQTHLDRAIAFITAYCKQAERKGRI